MTDPILQIPTRDDNGEVGHCTAPGVGLALSGGGSRAIAFHLECLGALHRNGLLARIDVLSTAFAVVICAQTLVGYTRCNLCYSTSTRFNMSACSQILDWTIGSMMDLAFFNVKSPFKSFL